MPVEYLIAGIRENNTLQELDIDCTFSENVEEFFEVANNLKALTVSFYESSWKISERFMSWYWEDIISNATDMLKRNKDMKFLNFKFFLDCRSVTVTIKDHWKEMAHQFWETVLLHPSLCYICVHIFNQFMRDILNDMKKSLITQREEKNLGPPPLVETASIIRI